MLQMEGGWCSASAKAQGSLALWIGFRSKLKPHSDIGLRKRECYESLSFYNINLLNLSLPLRLLINHSIKIVRGEFNGARFIRPR